jgi:hypothetical protein
MAGDFDWGIWGKKAAYYVGASVLTTGILALADFMQQTNFPPEYALYTSLTISVLILIGNALKHTVFAK